MHNMYNFSFYKDSQMTRRITPADLLRLLPALCALGCPPPDKDTGATGGGGGGDDTAAAVAALYVGTSDYEVGALASVSVVEGGALAEEAVRDAILTLPADHALAAGGGRLFVMGRSSENTVRAYGEDLLVPEAEFSTGDGSNPQDVAVCGGAWVVALYGAAELALYNEQGARIGSVDLAAWTDADGSPEASGLYAAPDGALYVTLNQLGADFRSLDGSGTLLKVDCTSWTVTGEWEVSPNASMVTDPLDPESLIILGGNYFLPDFSGPELDGAVYRFDTRSGTLSAPLRTEAEEGANIGLYVERGDARLVVTDDGYTWTIRCTGPEGDRTIEGDMFVSDALLDPEGRAWLAVRPGFGGGEPVSGLYRIDLSGCGVEGPIQTSLPPGALAWR